MKKYHRGRQMVSLLGAFFFVCPWAQATSIERSKAAAALFERFETVSYAEGIVLQDLSDPGKGTLGDLEGLRTPFWFLRVGLRILGKNASAEAFGAAEALLVGTKDYRAPKGLGAVRSQNCSIMILKAGTRFDFRDYIHGHSLPTAAGAAVWNWSGHAGEFGELDPTPSTFYGTLILNYLLVSNNLKEIEVIASHLTAPDDNSTIPKEISHWDWLNQHGVWSYRRYRHTGVVDRVAAGMYRVSPNTEALLFAVDWDSKRFVLRLFCCVDGDEGTPVKINASGILPRFKSVCGRGIYESSFSFTGGEEDVDERLFIVMNLLGFGIYL